MVLFWYNRVYKPGSVLTAIYLALWLPIGSSRLLGTAGSAYCPSTALLRDRVYSVKPMLPWAGWALTPPFHPYLAAVYFCCTCPGVSPGGRYPLSLPCGARTFLIRSLSACVRGCPTWLRKYCTPLWRKSQMSCKMFWERIYYLQWVNDRLFQRLWLRNWLPTTMSLRGALRCNATWQSASLIRCPITELPERTDCHTSLRTGSQ